MPSSRRNSCGTSPRVSTTGNRCDAFASTTPSSHGLYAEHLAAEEQRCGLRLVRRRRPDLPRLRELRQERLDFRRPHGQRVPLAGKPVEALNPVDVGLLGAQAVALDTDAPAHALERPRARRVDRARDRRGVR
jgi:hypothetical protein